MDTSRRIGDGLFPDSSDRQLQRQTIPAFIEPKPFWCSATLEDTVWQDTWLDCLVVQVGCSTVSTVVITPESSFSSSRGLSASQRLLRSLEAAEYTLLSLSEFMDNSSDNLVVLCVMSTRCGGVMWKYNGIDSDNWADCSSSAAPNLQIQLALLMLSHRSETTINQHYRIYPSTKTGHHIHAFWQQNSLASRIEQWDRQKWEQPQHTNAYVGWSDHNDSPDETLCC